MNKVTTSRWRLEARRIIREALAKLPEGATLQEKRRAIFAAYPFGQREHHPYRAWLIEQRQALGDADRQERKRLHTEVGYRLNPNMGLPWLDVLCCWCNGTVAGGCMACVRLHDRVEDVVREEEFRRLRKAAGGDEVARSVLLDWLEEQGITIARKS